jgi:DNA-binding transcriptional regulator YdaS (Cro superfamily)
VGTQENYRNSLRYAESIAGGRAQLALRLGVRPEEIDAWARGARPIPDTVFLTLVDIILEATPEQIDKARRYHP